MKFIVALLCALVVSTAHAKVNTGTTTIKEIYSYALAGIEGDSIFTVNDSITECTGFWIDASEGGAETLFAVLLSAYHSASPVLIYADETKTFSASSANFCKATIIRLRPR